MTTDELKKKYADAVTEITDIYADTKAVSVVSYQAKTKKKTEAVFEDLRNFTTEYCDKEIENIYRDSLEQLELDLYEEYGLEEDWHFDRVAEVNTIQEAKDDTESKLMWAIIAAEACLSNYTLRANMSFGDMAGFQEAMLKQIAEGGISGNAYFREGQIVQEGLSGYADVVLQGTQTMVSNQAVMDTMLANGWDLVKMSEHFGSCPICLPYQGRVFSLSGNSDEFPYLYDTGWSEMYQSFHPNCRHYIEPFFPQSVSPEELARLQAFSNRSFDAGGEGWTKEQTEEALRKKELYEAERKRKDKIYADKKQYDKYRAVLGDRVPKSFQGFYRLKHNDRGEWDALQAEFRKYNHVTFLKNQLGFVYNGNVRFIPKDAEITNLTTIAGKGAKRQIDDEPRLLEVYGGVAGEWRKMTGKIESDKFSFDVHWYENGEEQYEFKIKNYKER